MTERLEPEQDRPAMKLSFGSREFEATPDNTSLFQFMGRLACYNHVFMQTNEEDEEPTGTYVFNQHPVYPQMIEYMIANDYPMHLNLRQVAECDVNAFNQMVQQYTGDLDSELDKLLGQEDGA